MIEIDYSKFPPHQQELLRTAQFAIEVEQFVRSAVGQFLIARAEAERAAALEQLAQVNSHEARQIQELQMIVRRSDSFAQWLADAAMAGEAAEEQLRGGDA